MKGPVGPFCLHSAREMESDQNSACLHFTEKEATMQL